jgi:hypothetical protein
VLANLDNVSTSNVDDGAADALGGVDDDVVVLGHVESVQLLDLLAGLVQNTLINSIGNTVIDQLGEHQTILALVEHLECIGREGQEVANVGVTGQNSVDMSGEFGSLIFVDGVGDI